MTLQKIANLKFKKKVATLELHKKFPEFQEKISQIALSELSEEILKKIVRNPKKLKRLLEIKRSLADYS